MTHPPETSQRSADRLLRLLVAGDGLVEAGETPVVRVVTPDGLRRVRVTATVIARLIAEGLVVEGPGDTGPRRLRPTAAGLARVRRGGAGETDFRRQHGTFAVRRVDEGSPPVLVDEDESPLARLARRRDKDGRAFLSPSRLAAGERLRGDFTLARMMPTVTSNWSAGRVAAGSDGPGGLADLTDRALAARDRVRGALAAVGRDLADVLVDVCCFLKGLEAVESERRWPARSAKVVLDIALGRLADHYGLAEEARGPDRARRLRAWGSGDHRPAIGVGLDRPPSGAG